MATKNPFLDMAEGLNALDRGSLPNLKALQSENATLKKTIDQLRAKLIEAEARASRLAKLHARASQ